MEPPLRRFFEDKGSIYGKEEAAVQLLKVAATGKADATIHQSRCSTVKVEQLLYCSTVALQQKQSNNYTINIRIDVTCRF